MTEAQDLEETSDYCPFCAVSYPYKMMEQVEPGVMICAQCKEAGYPRKGQRVVGNCHQCHGDIYDWQKMHTAGGWKYHTWCFIEDEIRNETEGE